MALLCCLHHYSYSCSLSFHPWSRNWQLQSVHHQPFSTLSIVIQWQTLLASIWWNWRTCLKGFFSFLFNEIILELCHKSLKRKMQIFVLQMLTFVEHSWRVDKQEVPLLSPQGCVWRQVCHSLPSLCGETHESSPGWDPLRGEPHSSGLWRLGVWCVPQNPPAVGQVVCGTLLRIIFLKTIKHTIYYFKGNQ